MNRTRVIWHAASLVLAFALAAHAGPIASDSFQVGTLTGAPFGEYIVSYLDDGNIIQNPTVPTFNSAWGASFGHDATSTIRVDSTDLATSSFASGSGSVRFQYPSSLSTGRSVVRTIDQGYDLNSSAYYMAGLMAFDGTFSTATTATAYTGFLNTEDTYNNSVDTPNPGAGTGLRLGLQWGFQGNGAGGVDAMVRVRATSGDIVNQVVASNIAPGTHLFVAKVEPNFSGSNEQLTVWLDPANVGSEAAAGPPTLAPQLVSNWVPGGADTTRIIDTLAFNATNVGANAPVYYDEVRFSDDWSGLLRTGYGSAHLQQGWQGYSHLGAELRSGVTYNIGTSDQIVTGHHADPAIGDMRAVLGFDLDNIPEGARIIDAHLVMSVKSHTGSNLQEVELWRIEHPTATMDETTVTWNNVRSGVPWTAPGGDLDFATLLETIPGFSDTAPKTFGGSAAFIAAVQDALTSGMPLELALWSPLTEANTAQSNFVRWWSDDASSITNRPLLIVDYYVPEPATCTLLLLGGAFAAWRRRRSR